MRAFLVWLLSFFRLLFVCNPPLSISCSCLVLCNSRCFPLFTVIVLSPYCMVHYFMMCFVVSPSECDISVGEVAWCYNCRFCVWCIFDFIFSMRREEY